MNFHFMPSVGSSPYPQGVTMKAFLVALCLFSISVAYPQTIWLDECDLLSMEIGWGTPQSKLSVDGHPLKIAGTTYARGVGTHSVSTFLIHLDGKGKRFLASVGVDDEVGKSPASVEFYLLGDKQVLWKSGTMKVDDPAKAVDVDVSNVKLLGLLVTDAGDGIDYDHADWCDARIEGTGTLTPATLTTRVVHQPYILTPMPSDTPKIHSASVFGLRPGNPCLYTIAATGKRPMEFSADNLPAGLSIDGASGRITGSVKKPGEYRATLRGRNALGTSQLPLRIIVGDAVCLTPPMGWNSWNCWAEAVDEQKVRAAADAMVSSGLIDHGWTYINIDDCWMIKPNSTDSLTKGEARDMLGKINSNKKFGDMKALADDVHAKGLKLGIYSSPGPLTCAGYTACYEHESQDAVRFGEWGIDYLKYDWCSYDKIAKDHSGPELQKPYIVMRKALNNVPRDIVYSLCQYGMGDVWTWGVDVGGNCWRTTGDITDTWSSMAGIGFNQTGHEKYAGPGHWNDPDMLVVGSVGWGPSLHPSRLSPDEQYTHISLWCLLSAPLLIGCDLSHLDDFTKNLLSNDEVLAVDQDPLGNQAHRILDTGGVQVFAKQLEDGSMAVGLFNVGKLGGQSPAEYFDWDNKASVTASLPIAALGWAGRVSVRDLWRQKELGVFESSFSSEIPRHGVMLVKVTHAPG